IVWTRIFQLQLGTSIYSFSMVLGIYLLGSAIGSLLSGKLYKNIKNPIKTLGYLIIFIGLYTIAGLYLFTLFTPVAISESLGISKILIPLIVIFPVTFTLGIIFPIVSSCFVKSRNKIGNGIGFLYSMNTLGCIVGSLFAGYILIKYFGTRNTVILVSLINCLMGFIVLTVGLEKLIRNKNLIIASILLIAGLLISIYSPDPFYTVIKKVVYSSKSKMEVYYHKEGISATTTAYGSKTDFFDKHILINGMGMTSLVSETKLMAHLPVLLNGDAKDVLIICFGMGTCLKSCVTHEKVNIEIVELVGEEYETYNYFHKNGSEILKNPRVKHFADDGRNYLLLRDKKYDVITIDPAPPLWSAGTVNLYTRNFFELCKKHLSDKGIFCLWIPPCQYTEVKMIIKTYIDVFPNTIIFSGIKYKGFYMLGAKEPIKINVDKFKEAKNDKNIMNDINEWENIFNSPEEMLNLKVADAYELREFLENEKIITDNYPYTEFPLWRKTYNKNFNVWFDADMLKKILKGELRIGY
ncbi:MAG: fused MFS/spermidine synthase, partial [Bacteroidales bacterium]